MWTNITESQDTRNFQSVRALFVMCTRFIRILPWSFQEHHLSCRYKKMPHISFNIYMPCTYGHWGTFIVLNFSRQSIWTGLCLSEIIYCPAVTHSTRWLVDWKNRVNSHETLKINLLNFTLEYKCTQARIQRFRVLRSKIIFITIHYQ